MKHIEGTEFTADGHKWAVVDYLTVTNLSGEVVRNRYVGARKGSQGELITYEFKEATVSKGLL